MFSAIQRAFASNLQKVVVKPSERSQLETAGIHNPVIQTYLTWRLGLMSFVVISTFLSAGLSTYLDLFEEEERVDIIEKVIETAQSRAVTAISSQPPLVAPIINEVLKSDVESEEKEAEAPGESTAGTPAKSTDETPTKAAHKSFLSRIDDLVHLISLYLLPVAALASILFWNRFQLTFRIMLGAFAFSFIMPILLSFCPWSWWEAGTPTANGPATPLNQAERISEGLVEGFSYLTMLLPTVLSLLPGVQKACVRVKTLLPQSVLPGWMLVSASPFYGLFLLVICVAINQIFDSPLIVLGMLFVMASSLYYGIRWRVFTRPLVSPDDFRQLYSAQRVAGLLTAVGGCFVLVYLTTQSIMGYRLLGLDPKTSIVIPLDLVEFFLETIGRSMFMTAFGADLFLLMNLAAWQSARPHQNTPAAQDYDNTMQAFEQAA